MADALLPLPILQGERCLLRALAPADAVALQRHADDVELARRLRDGFPSPYTLADAQAWCGGEANSGASGYVWGVVADGEVVGCAGLVPQQGWLRCNAEIGYWIGAARWRQGFASDAVRQITDWAFAALPELTRIFAPVFCTNDASHGVVRRCGYVREGVQKQSAIKDGQVIDRAIWATYRVALPTRPADIDAALAITANNAMERA